MEYCTAIGIPESTGSAAPDGVDRRTLGPYLFVVVGLFLISRLLYYRAGIRFDTSPAQWAWMFIDVQLLREDLLRSLYYLHSQPPLFNGLVGWVFKAFPGNEAAYFSLLFAALGLFISIALFSLMRGVGIAPLLAALLTSIFVISPSCILYENWLFYTYPTVALLCLAALLFRSLLRHEGQFAYALAFFIVLSLIVLTRSLFHFLWILLFLAVALSLLPRRRIALIAGFLIPFVPLVLWHVKNYSLFGSFTTSSWLGMSLSKMTIQQMSPDERLKLLRDGLISPISLVPPFSSIESYRPYVQPMKKTGIPILDNEFKSNGLSNGHSLPYVYISRTYLKDALNVIIKKPTTYLSGIFWAWGLFFVPSSEYGFLEANKAKIRSLELFYNLVFCGRPTLTPLLESRRNTHGDRLLQLGYFIVVGYIVAITYGLLLILRSFSQRPLNLAFTGTILFLWLNICYVSITSNMLEVSENMRFRFLIEPFVLILVGLYFNNLLRRVKRPTG